MDAPQLVSTSPQPDPQPTNQGNLPNWFESVRCSINEGCAFHSGLEQTRVVLILERHTTGDKRALIDLINAKFSKGDILLTEGRPGNQPRWEQLKDHIKKASVSWDTSGTQLDIVAKNCLSINKIGRFLLELSIKFACATTRCELYAENETLAQIVESLSLFDPSKQDWLKSRGSETCLSKYSRITSCKSLNEGRRCLIQPIERWLTQCQETYDLFMREESAACKQRQNSLISTILSSSVLEKNRIWVVAGASHGMLISPQYFQGVEQLYSRLQQERLTYGAIMLRVEPEGSHFIWQSRSTSESDALKVYKSKVQATNSSRNRAQIGIQAHFQQCKSYEELSKWVTQRIKEWEGSVKHSEEDFSIFLQTVMTQLKQRFEEL